MGVIIPFAQIKRVKATACDSLFGVARNDDRAITDAIHAGADQGGVLAAARPLLDRCRDRYGFVVMRDGLPKEPAILRGALLGLSRGLSILEADMRAPRTYLRNPTQSGQ